MSDSCKSCGGCATCTPCNHCNNCRVCGKPILARPYPYSAWPYYGYWWNGYMWVYQAYPVPQWNWQSQSIIANQPLSVGTFTVSNAIPTSVTTTAAIPTTVTISDPGGSGWS